MRRVPLLSLKARRREPEWMDQPGLEAGLHQDALAALRRVNRISGTARWLWRPIHRLAGEGASRPLRILDLASGGGDVAVGLALEARRAGVTVEIDGCDISPLAVTLAQAQACGAGLTQLRFFKHDVVRDELPRDYDIVTCSLFLHHLDEADAVRVMRKMALSAKRLVLIDDLRRSPLGYALAWTGCRMLTRSPVAHTDGPRSVRAAFTLDEVARLADQAGLASFRLSRHWPQRFLLSWSNL